jgi:hypothetical protein
MPSSTFVSPFPSAFLEQPLEWLFSQSRASLRDGAFGHGRASTFRHDEIQPPNQLIDGSVPVQSHPEHKPNDLLGGQPPPAQRRCPGRFDRLIDPFRIDACPKALECPLVSRRTSRERTSCHAIASLRSPHLDPELVGKIPISALTDRHWG